MGCDTDDRGYYREPLAVGKYYTKEDCGIIVCPNSVSVYDDKIHSLIQYYSKTGRYMGYEPVIIPVERVKDWVEYATLEEARYGKIIS